MANEKYDPWKDMVTVNIPRDRKTKEDQVVSVNGRRFTIKKGVPVAVPRPLFEVLRDQEATLDAIEKFDDENANN